MGKEKGLYLINDGDSIGENLTFKFSAQGRVPRMHAGKLLQPKGALSRKEQHNIEKYQQLER